MLTTEEWRHLSDEEKADIARTWHPYTEDVDRLMRCIVEEFKICYGHLE